MWKAGDIFEAQNDGVPSMNFRFFFVSAHCRWNIAGRKCLYSFLQSAVLFS